MDNNKNTTIIELINIIKKRPSMYVGDKNQLNNLNFIIYGFLMNNILNDKIDNIDILFRKNFYNWVRDWFNSKENFNFESKSMDYVYYIKFAYEE